jgi:hypothetical protein
MSSRARKQLPSALLKGNTSDGPRGARELVGEIARLIELVGSSELEVDAVVGLSFIDYLCTRMLADLTSRRLRKFLTHASS